MPGSEDGAAAEAEARFEALRRFVDERYLASHQQRPVHAAEGAHVPPLQVPTAARHIVLRVAVALCYNRHCMLVGAVTLA